MLLYINGKEDEEGGREGGGEGDDVCFLDRRIQFTTKSEQLR
jgi:hypothetical protein